MTLASLRPWQISFLIHASLAVAFLGVLKVKLPDHDVLEVPIEVSEPQTIQKITETKDRPRVVLKSVNQDLSDPTPKREVFGANRNSHTDASLGDEGIVAKKGNTLTKESDKTILLDSDADVLPEPTEDYLVSDMPSVLSEVKPVYPKEAREKELEGSVILDILIDQKGMVRQVSVIEGPQIFRAGAVEAMKKFLFRPARVDGKAVAVRIRYSLKFELEY